MVGKILWDVQMDYKVREVRIFLNADWADGADQGGSEKDNFA